MHGRVISLFGRAEIITQGLHTENVKPQDATGMAMTAREATYEGIGIGQNKMRQVSRNQATRQGSYHLRESKAQATTRLGGKHGDRIRRKYP
jgi:hypothetical protein